MSRQSHIILLRTGLRNTTSLPEPSSRPLNKITVIVCVEKRKPVNPSYARIGTRSSPAPGAVENLALSPPCNYLTTF